MAGTASDNLPDTGLAPDAALIPTAIAKEIPIYTEPLAAPDVANNVDRVDVTVEDLELELGYLELELGYRDNRRNRAGATTLTDRVDTHVEDSEIELVYRNSPTGHRRGPAADATALSPGHIYQFESSAIPDRRLSLNDVPPTFLWTFISGFWLLVALLMFAMWYSHGSPEHTKKKEKKTEDAHAHACSCTCRHTQTYTKRDNNTCRLVSRAECASNQPRRQR